MNRDRLEADLHEAARMIDNVRAAAPVIDPTQAAQALRVAGLTIARAIVRLEAQAKPAEDEYGQNVLGQNLDRQA